MPWILTVGQGLGSGRKKRRGTWEWLRVKALKTSVLFLSFPPAPTHLALLTLIPEFIKDW